jgi:hypothetical protein
MPGLLEYTRRHFRFLTRFRCGFERKGFNTSALAKVQDNKQEAEWLKKRNS